MLECSAAHLFMNINITSVSFKNLHINRKVPMGKLLTGFNIDNRALYARLVADKKRPLDPYTIDAELFSIKAAVAFSKGLALLRGEKPSVRGLNIFEFLIFLHERAYTSCDQRFFTEQYAVRPLPDVPGPVKGGKAFFELEGRRDITVYPDDVLVMTTVSDVDAGRFRTIENAVDSFNSDQVDMTPIADS